MRRKCVRAGCLVMMVGVAVVALTIVTHLPFLLIAIGWALGGFGIGLAWSANSLLCISAAPTGKEGEVSGQLQLMEAIGTAAGTGLGGGLLLISSQLGRTPRLALLITWICTIVMAMVGALLSSRLPLPQRDAQSEAQPDDRSDVSV